MNTSGTTISALWLQSPQARRLGFKLTRFLSVRELSLVVGNPSPAVYGTLAFLLAAGFVTSASKSNMPLLIAPNQKAVYEFDTATERMQLSEVKYDVVIRVEWGCVAPIFDNLVEPPHQINRSCGSFSVFDDGRLQFEAIKQADLTDFRQLISTDDCLGFVEDEPCFNSALSLPINIENIRSHASFRYIFPSDNDIEAAKHGNSPANIDHGTSSLRHDSMSHDTIGRIVISYRHQEYGANRITFDDWLCACPSLELVFNASGWRQARFWTDARLRLLSAQRNFQLPWARMGLEPYSLGQVVVLNLSTLPSVCDRFWLTLERKRGAHYYGTWLTDDAGDMFFYKLYSDEDVHARAVLTSVSTSQGITWREDRVQILKDTWDYLEIENVEDALEMLRGSRTFEAREDYVDEDLEDIEIAKKGETIQWCGDTEGLIDPPLLAEMFGSVGKQTNDMKLRVVEIEKTVKMMEVVVTVLERRVGQRSEFMAKRLYIDANGEIRARSTPRLVDLDYVDGLLSTGKAREVDLQREQPSWMSGTRVSQF